MGHVVAVDHHRSEFEIQLLRKRQRIQPLDEKRHVLVTEGLADLNHELAAASQVRRCVGVRLGAGFQPGFARMPSSAWVGSHVGRAPEAGNAVCRHRRAVSLEVDLQGRADKHIARIKPRGLAEGAVRAERAVGAGEEDVGAGTDVLLHSHFRTEAVDLFDPAGLDCGNQRGMRIQRPVGANLAPEAELLAVGRKQELDRSGVEADAVIEPADAIGSIEALDREHRRENLSFGDGRGIAGEEWLDIEGLARRHHEMHLVAGNIDARHPVDDLLHLRDDQSTLEARRLDDRRRVFGVGAGIEIAFGVCADCRDQRDVGGQLDKVAGKELQTGVNPAELDLSAKKHSRDPCRLRAGVSVVQPLCHAALEHIEVLGKDHAGLHHMKIVDLRRINVSEGGSENVGLLLIVTLQTDPVARTKNCFQEIGQIRGRNCFAARVARPCLDAGLPRRFLPFPVFHFDAPAGNGATCVYAIASLSYLCIHDN